MMRLGGGLPVAGNQTGRVQTGLLLLITIPVIAVYFAAYLAWSTAIPGTATGQNGIGTGDESLAYTGGEQAGRDSSEGELVILAKIQADDQQSLTTVERNLLLGFTAERRLQPLWITYRTVDELFHYLNNNAGDLIIASFDMPEIEFDDPIKYTLPWGISRQQVVIRSGTQRISSINDLATRQVAIKQSSPAWPSLQALSAASPGMHLQLVPEHASTDTILARVSSGHYDLAVLDNFSLDQSLPHFLDLEVAYSLDGDKVMTWAVRSSSETLHQSLNQFLYKNHLKLNVTKFYREDMPALQQRRVLRLITYQNPVNYFLDKGELQGFEYELLERFAHNNGMRLGVVIANRHEDMAEMLRKGLGDVIAASLPPESYAGTSGVSYTRYYGYAAPLVIGRALDYPLLDARDLAHRRIVLPAESPYRAALERIRSRGIPFDLIEAPAGLNTNATLYRVSQGEFDLTVLGSHQINAEFVGQLNLKSHFALSEPAPQVWAVRTDAGKLLHALNAYIDKEYRQGFYNVLLDKYIENPVPLEGNDYFAENGRLSPYDDIVHKYADQYGFDWRLIVAQMYQESRFNPQATSYAGAEGLMQLIPDTAALLGITDLNDPDASIFGGIKYMAYLRDRFEDDLLMEDRTWFTLAAYNAGYNRVKRARWLADRMGLDQDRWFDNVERAMQALSRPYRKNGVLVRDCNCGQTTYYIREIRTLYNNYVRLTQSVRLAAAQPAVEQDS